jgi:hypothetical protein
VPTSIVIKLLASRPLAAPVTGVFNVCNPATAGTTVLTPLEWGMVAWGSTLEPAATPGTYAPVNVPFIPGNMALITQPVDGIPPFSLSGFIKFDGLAAAGVAPLPGTELAGLTALCNFIQANGTGFGICKSCRLGALGGSKK